MFSSTQLSHPTRPTYQRGLVECEKCRTPIVVKHPTAVAVEFCVPCPRCGHRGIYFKRMIYIEDAVERRQKKR